MVKRYHPDVNREPRAKERFLEIREAYETLSNPLARRVYDERMGIVPWERPRPVANVPFERKVRIARYRTVGPPFRSYGAEVSELGHRRREQTRRIARAVWSAYVAVVGILVVALLVLGASAATSGLPFSGAVTITAALTMLSFLVTAWAARRLGAPGP